MTEEARLYSHRDLDEVECVDFCGGQAALFTSRAPASEDANEDAALLLELGDNRGVLAVADGMGGRASGEVASHTILSTLLEKLRTGGDLDTRPTVLEAIDEANAALMELGTGAGSTLCLVEIDGESVRSYHVGDSIVLVAGQRGKRKLEIIPHSPVGYAVEAGMLGEEEALLHEERHIISVMMGEPGMRISVSAPVGLAPRDTLLLASDGIADNLRPEEVIETIRKGPLDRAAAMLRESARQRMEAPTEGEPSKPDDLTFILFRRRPGESAT